MRQNISLCDASVQEIHLELLRRTKFNALDGGRIAASLLQHRDLWLAVILDRPGIPNYREPRLLLSCGLIKLRDLPEDFWNADTLFILTRTHAHARQLGEIAEEEDWCGEVQVFDKQQEIDEALGVYGEEYGLVSIWWD